MLVQVGRVYVRRLQAKYTVKDFEGDVKQCKNNALYLWQHYVAKQPRLPSTLVRFDINTDHKAKKSAGIYSISITKMPAHPSFA